MLRTLLVIVLAVHGVIHVLGFAKAFGFARLSVLTLPIGRQQGVFWAITALLFLLAASVLLLGSDRWWMPAAVALILSQFLIAMNWHDARFGTVANMVLSLAVISGAAIWDFRSRYTEAATHVQEDTRSLPDVRIEEPDLLRVPLPVQRYLRASGVVGRIQPHSMRIVFEGAIRGFYGPWMPFTSVQTNRFDEPARFFWIDARMKGLPTKGLHAFENGKASMLIKLLGVVPVMEAQGPEMDQAETVTWFNDLCIYAPGALLDDRITWNEVDDHSAEATFTHGGRSIRATLVFNGEDRLVDFFSDDRYALADGKATAMRFSTPLRDHRVMNGLVLPGYGEAVWIRSDGPFVYGTFNMRSITYDP